MSDSRQVLGTQELRHMLPQALDRLSVNASEVVIVGRRRVPEAVLISYRRWEELGGTVMSENRPRHLAATAPDDLHWDPAAGVDYEVAESVLGDLISYAVARLWDADHAEPVDAAAHGAWRERVAEYAAERRRLTLTDPAAVREVLERRGAELRALTGRG